MTFCSNLLRSILWSLEDQERIKFLFENFQSSMRSTLKILWWQIKFKQTQRNTRSILQKITIWLWLWSFPLIMQLPGYKFFFFSISLGAVCLKPHFKPSSTTRSNVHLEITRFLIVFINTKTLFFPFLRRIVLFSLHNSVSICFHRQ